MSELHTVATIPIKPEAADEMRGVLAGLAAQTRSEDGCLAYDLYESAVEPGYFITIERWRGQDELDAHLAAPAVKEALASAADKLAGEVSVHPLRPVNSA